MPEQIKNIYKKALEYWNKWTTKQKTIIISVFAGVIVAVSLLVFLLGRTHYTELYKFDSTENASRAVSTLKNAGYISKLGSDGMTVMVDEDYYVEAVTTIYSSDIGDDGFSIDDLLDTSLTTTNSERLLRTFLRSESKMEKAIMCINGITSVSINYIAKDTSNSVIAANQTIPASVIISYNSSFDKSRIEGIAQIVAKGLGNETTDEITIVDQYGEVLFDGSVTDTEELDLTDKLAMEKYLKNEYKEYVTGALVMNGFTEVDVATHLELNWDKVTEMFQEYIPIDGEIHGVLYERHTTTSESTNSDENIPGTDSNDETDAYITTGSSGNSESTTQDDYYEPSVRVTEKVYDSGTITDASISVTARRVVTRTKSELELLGALDDTSYEKYILDNADPVRTETSEELVKVVALATGIDEDNVILVTYDVYQFVNDQVSKINVTMVVQVALAAILMLILLFVILKGLKPVEITEVEPELSIEQLLATTKENQSLEDVEFSEESETRRMIEKFFDEHPEAVAALLRNWLNEDWM